MLSTYEQRSRLKLASTLVAVLVIAGLVLIADHLKSQASGNPAHVQSSVSRTGANDTAATNSGSPASGNTSTSGATAGTSSSGGYKDGTYTASSDYFVPDGNENIQVDLTLQNGVITGSSLENSETDPTSAEFQKQFAAVYKSYVVGKKISVLHLSNIAGASDTTQAFNDAVSQIAAKAQS